jgi:hypothetical protein
LTFARLPRKCSVFEAKYSAKQMREYALRCMKEKQEMTLDIKEEEREVLREHIVWLTQELERTRNSLKERNALLRELLNPDSLGWGVNSEIRSRIYNLFSAELEQERASWNTK